MHPEKVSSVNVCLDGSKVFLDRRMAYNIMAAQGFKTEDLGLSENIMAFSVGYFL